MPAPTTITSGAATTASVGGLPVEAEASGGFGPARSVALDDACGEQPAKMSSAAHDATVRTHEHRRMELCRNGWVRLVKFQHDSPPGALGSSVGRRTPGRSVLDNGIHPTYFVGRWSAT